MYAIYETIKCSFKILVRNASCFLYVCTPHTYPFFFFTNFLLYKGDDADEGYVGVELPEYACKFKPSERIVVI